MGLSPKEVEASHDGEAQKEQDVHPCRSKHPRAYKPVPREHIMKVGNDKVGVVKAHREPRVGEEGEQGEKEHKIRAARGGTRKR